jgi:hypothetical protein
MKLPSAICVAGSFWLFSSVLQQVNKVYLENASDRLKLFNLFMLGASVNLLYRAITFSEYQSNC